MRAPISRMNAYECLRHWWGARRFFAGRPFNMPVRPISRVLYGAFRERNARDGHSSATPVARRLKRPTRMAGPDRPAARRLRAIPIRFCSRWGLPCRLRCRKRGALLPHRFTLAAKYATRRGGLLLCGTVPGARSPLSREQVPAGRYPAPFVRGARTFLPRALSSLARAAVQPTDALRDGEGKRPRQGRNSSSSS